MRDTAKPLRDSNLLTDDPMRIYPVHITAPTFTLVVTGDDRCPQRTD